MVVHNCNTALQLLASQPHANESLAMTVRHATLISPDGYPELQCVFDDGKPEHRVCKFHNLLVYQTDIHYVWSGIALMSQYHHPATSIMLLPCYTHTVTVMCWYCRLQHVHRPARCSSAARAAVYLPDLGVVTQTSTATLLVSHCNWTLKL